MCRVYRYIRSIAVACDTMAISAMRGSGVRPARDIQLIEMKSAIDRRTVLRHVGTARFWIVSPALANFGRKRCFKRALIARGAEDNAGARFGGAGDFRPKLDHLRGR